MSLIGFKAQNHQQQTSIRGAKDEIDDRETDPRVFQQISEMFGPFTLDAAANHHNAKCDRYFTRQDDGLSQSWAGESVWCNPPFSNIEPRVRKAWKEHETADGIVMLLPANRTEQKWWQDHVEPRRDTDGSPLKVHFLRGRLRFLEPGEQQVRPNSRPPFGVCLLHWRAPS